MAAVRAPRIAAAVAACTVAAVPLAFLFGGRLAASPAPTAANATIQSIDVAGDRAGACTPGNLLEDSPAVLYVGLRATHLSHGAAVTFSITGPDGSDTATVAAPRATRSGCAIVAMPASISHAKVWASGDYAISVAVGRPPRPSGPVTAFSIAAGITDD